MVPVYRHSTPPTPKLFRLISIRQVLAQRKVDMALVGDKSTLRALPLVKPSGSSDKRTDYREQRAGYCKPSDKAIHPQYLAQQINRMTMPSLPATLAPTVGNTLSKMNGKRRACSDRLTTGRWLMPCRRLRHKRTRTSGWQCAVTAALAMLMGDFLSVVQMKLPVKIIVFLTACWDLWRWR